MGPPIKGWMAAVTRTGRTQANKSQHMGALGKVRRIRKAIPFYLPHYTRAGRRRRRRRSTGSGRPLLRGASGSGECRRGGCGAPHSRGDASEGKPLAGEAVATDECRRALRGRVARAALALHTREVGGRRPSLVGGDALRVATAALPVLGERLAGRELGAVHVPAASLASTTIACIMGRIVVGIVVGVAVGARAAKAVGGDKSTVWADAGRSVARGCVA